MAVMSSIPMKPNPKPRNLHIFLIHGKINNIKISHRVSPFNFLRLIGLCVRKRFHVPLFHLFNNTFSLTHIRIYQWMILTEDLIACISVKYLITWFLFMDPFKQHHFQNLCHLIRISWVTHWLTPYLAVLSCYNFWLDSKFPC